MGSTFKFHLTAAVVALCCGVLGGCVLAELHLTASPVPPWVDFTVRGLVDEHPAVVGSFPGATQTAPTLTTQPITP